ncbi:MAG: undecaprenyl-diphosphatase, partial [Desulfovibrio sp.]|nr:undecaprenyl-diphosphatase [Desulfovibrio sp.]
MNEYAAAAILGLVQGLTEFLPVSSTGHLIIASSLMGLQGERIVAFEVFIQFGSILAVVFLYWRRFLGLLLPRPGERFSGRYGLWLLVLTSLPASLAGLLFSSRITAHLFHPLSVSLALAAGA